MPSNQPGLIVTPRFSAIGHPTGDTGFDNVTAGTKFVGIIANREVFRVSETEFTWKGISTSGISGMQHKQASLTTTDNTETTLLSLPALSVGQSIHFRVLVGGEQNTEAEASTFSVVGAATNAAGTTALKGSASITAVESDSNTNLVVDVDDALETVRIRVVGITGETWLWSAIADFFTISG